MRSIWCILCCLTAAVHAHQPATEPPPGEQNDPPDNPPDNNQAEQPSEPADDPNVSTPEEIEKADERDLSALTADSVTSLLTDLREGRLGTFIGGPLDRGKTHWDNMNAYLDENAGLRLGLAYTALVQGATPGDGNPAFDNIRYAASGDLDLFGQLRITAPDNINRSVLVFQLENRHRYTEIPPSDLGAQIGSLWRTTSGFNDKSSVKQVYWDQRLLDGRVQVRVGKLDQSDVIGSHRLESANQYFLNAAFSANPVAALPDNGFGINAGFLPTDWLYIAAGVGDANGRTSDFEQILEAAEFYRSFEIGAISKTGLGEGNYRLTLWETDARKEAGLPDDSGFAITLGQQVGERLTVVARYALSDGLLTPTEEMAMLALGVSKPLGLQDDYAGIGVAWGDPSDPRKREQFTAEAFYRIQLASTVQLTPDVQLIVNPTNAPEDDLVGVFGLRLRIVY